ncbi:MAG: hypothetical protein N2117_08360, partial [Anaerolineales bacterium]|nr:hypothetical protein [Anaerolineales bacterium]
MPPTLFPFTVVVGQETLRRAIITGGGDPRLAGRPATRNAGNSRKPISKSRIGLNQEAKAQALTRRERHIPNHPPAFE